jgi:hypothetical protein
MLIIENFTVTGQQGYGKSSSQRNYDAVRRILMKIAGKLGAGNGINR